MNSSGIKKELLESLQNDCGRYHIAVLGDVMLDHYIYGRAERISPEAPVPVIGYIKEQYMPGGAANVAANLKALGCEVSLFSVVGQDHEAELLKSLLEQQGITHKNILHDKQRLSTCKTRIVSSNQQMLRLDKEQTNPLSIEKTEELVHELMTQHQKKAIHAIILQDYNKGVLHPLLIERLIKFCNEQSIRVHVDPKKDHFFDYQNVQLFKPNLKEAAQACGMEESADPEQLLRLSEHLHRRLGMKQLMITCGAQGIWIYDHQVAELVPTQVLSVRDVSGAGDTVISLATVLACLDFDFKQIAQLCNLAGGQVCQKSGVVTVDKVELLQEISAI
ncbi:MAG TPA: bifunctional ADP-heptose synthase [Saprospiraceae bacterium]|nr:bifunctional ADP-heptose synthase [Saprospiraceae bacterium]